MVFASLDFGFGVGSVSHWGLTAWNLGGLALLFLGIFLEPRE